MSEKDRMKEGRRMFQIFAARMFEQRVLTAYREKVALERQQKLLEELDDESRIDAQREAKKAKEAQKKKDKKRQQKQAKDEEKAKRDAEKAAEEAAAKALEEKKALELRQRKEEQRKKKEADKKAQEEERQRKEAEKQRRMQELKEQQAEQERKQREQKEQEKKKREEIKKKEREERERKEKEVREKKERDARAKSGAEAKIQNREDESAKQSSQTAQSIPKRLSPATSASSMLHPTLTTSSHASPHLQIATPVVPKAPTPMRQRQPSFKDSRNTSPKTSLPASSSSTNSPGVLAGPNGMVIGPGKGALAPILTQQSQPSSHYTPIGAPSGQLSQPPGLSSMPSMVANAFPSSTFGPPLSPMTQQAPHHPAMYSSQATVGANQYRNFMAPNGLSFPPGINGSRQMPQGRGGILDPPPSQLPPIGLPSVNLSDVSRYGLSRENIPSHTHSRNTSASFDRSVFDTPTTPAQAQPIARPAPIKRPSSAAPHQQGGNATPVSTDVDDLNAHFGSASLLEETDVPLTSTSNDSRRGSMAPGATRSVRQGFGINSGFSDPIGSKSSFMVLISTLIV